jgi:hypothetical protein
MRVDLVNLDFNILTTSSWNFKLQDFPNAMAFKPESLTVRGF